MSQLALCFDNVVGTQKRYVSQTCRVHHHNLDAALKTYGFTDGMLKVVNQLAYNLKTPKVIAIHILAEKSLTSESTVKRALKKLKDIGFLKVENQGFKKPSKLVFCWPLFIEFLEELKISITGKLRDHLLYWQQKLSAKPDSAKNAPTEKTLFSEPFEPPALPTLASDRAIGHDDTHLKINNIKLFMHTAAKNFFSNLDFSNFRNISQSNQKTDTSKNPTTPLDVFLNDAERVLKIERPLKTNQLCAHFKTVYINNFQTNTDNMRLYLEHVVLNEFLFDELMDGAENPTEVALKVMNFDFFKLVQMKTDHHDPNRKILIYPDGGKLQIVAHGSAPKVSTAKKIVKSSGLTEQEQIKRNREIGEKLAVGFMERISTPQKNLTELESKNLNQFIWGLLNQVILSPQIVECLQNVQWDKENRKIILLVKKETGRFLKNTLIGEACGSENDRVKDFIDNHSLIKNNGLTVIWKDQE
jgi:hypothetical protein